ncbi:MAG: hypothetical protein ABIH99_05525, partial [Candidatus Micrarchaeota archaeon]
MNRERSRKAQAAMEYLVTYGWAILIILVAMSLLYSMGIFSPSRYIPEECYFQPSFACKSAFLKDAGANSYDFELVVQNEMGFEMFIESVNIT